MWSLKVNRMFKNYMYIEIIVFGVFLKIGTEELSRIINGKLFHSLGAAY